MHWWHSAFSSLSSSHSPSSSSPSSTADDNFINNRSNSRMYDVVSLFTSRRSAGSQQRRRITGPRKLQNVADDDVDQATAQSMATPQALPLPELAVLFKRDARREVAVNQSKYVLPSPEDATKKCVEKRGISDANHGDSKGLPCIASSDRSRDTERTESQSLQKSSQVFNTGNFRDEHKHGETVSAPTTPISTSPICTPLETPQDVSNNCPTIPERIIHGCDNSLMHSPHKCTSVKNPIFSSSPWHKNSFTENVVGRRDSNAQATVATVHPLPLPPGAASIYSPSSSQINYKPDPAPKTPTRSQWQKGKLIGRGTFGSVYVGSNRETGALCAMKEVELLPDDPKVAECIKQLEQEINVLSHLKHPNIVQYYGSEIVEDRFYIYLEYVHPGSINKYVRDHCGGMTESIVRNFTRHIVSGLAYLHSTKTIHRDIKGANLLVDANGVVKLADFGMAKHLNGQVSHLSLKGSPYWMAPELLQGGTQNDTSPDLALAVDIWSLGCTIIEMMNGKPPWSEFEGAAAMFKVMKETPPIPETMSPDGKDFLRCCFTRSPAERPKASMLLEHRFLNNSTQLDVPSSTNSLNRMTLTDKSQNRRDRSSHKPVQLSMPTDTTTKGKLLNKYAMLSC